MTTTRDFLPPGGSYEQLIVRYDEQFGAVWYTLEPRDRPCFNLDLLEELRQFQLRIESVIREAAARGERLPVRYTVLCSAVPGVFNLGGDLNLFAELIRRQDRRALFRYAKACIDVLYPNAVNFDQPLTTITLVQGDALGGGFEAAVSSNVVIAERSAKFGLPEVLFNLVPGMGAYSFLIRRTTPDTAERIIMTGELLSAHDMRELKLVDRVVEDGTGEAAVLAFMREHSRRSNAHAAMGRIRRCINPVTYEELIGITRIWVDAALQLTERDLTLIERLVQAQNRRLERAAAGRQAMEGRA
ncbi:MAG TPA: crotonase/enoyl-CoA hydratase family protein [Candidatus Krumholzibacteria bacterium]|nr:crotonase/enoyl-CoA hydratase family protein [Candidatus Krumholzibacteria bacterium]